MVAVFIRRMIYHEAIRMGDAEMKIALIGFTKLAYMPYMNFYLNQFSEQHDVHVLYWNRNEKDDITLPYKVKLHEFKRYQEDQVANIKKVRSFHEYRKFAKKVLKEENFDRIVIMHTLPGVLLYDVLKKHYSTNYILDYRDVTHENSTFYKRIIHKLVHHSMATFVSSDAFRVYLPKSDRIYTSHNLLLDSMDHREVRRRLTRDETPIRIRFWGFIRHESVNKAMIDRLGNDERYEIHYHGREQETAANLKEHCRINNIANVFFHGEYLPEERYLFASETDIIHNVFDNDKRMQPAMANKYYDGLALYIPQLCRTGSYMGRQVKDKGVGFACDPQNATFADDLYEYYHSISWNEFEYRCDRELERILSEYMKGIHVLKKVSGDP